MATKKPIASADEKFTNMDFPLFPAMEALDRKDYSYYDRLTAEQQKGFVPFMLTHWMSAVQSRDSDIQQYYVQSTNEAANKYLLHEAITKHPKLQWLMLCAVSPNVGKQFHKYIPHIKQRVSLLQDPAKFKDTREYFAKIYPKTSDDLLDEVSNEFVQEQKRKHYLAQTFPNLKHTDIETLNGILTDADIEQYEKDRGN
jgi:hypothetical protein